MAELSAQPRVARTRDPGPSRRDLRGSQRKGEAQQATAAGLDLLRVLGWLVLHDVVLPADPTAGAPAAAIDHVLIGPSGVYVVTTVGWSGAITAHDGLLVVGKSDHSEVLAESAAAADAVRTLLGGTPVAPLLCFERLEAVAGVAGGVALCASENILDLLTSQPQILDSAAVAHASGRLAAACRPGSGTPLPTVADQAPAPPPTPRPVTGPTVEELARARAEELAAEARGDSREEALPAGSVQVAEPQRRGLGRALRRSRRTPEVEDRDVEVAAADDRVAPDAEAAASAARLEHAAVAEAGAAIWRTLTDSDEAGEVAGQVEAVTVEPEPVLEQTDEVTADEVADVEVALVDADVEAVDVEAALVEAEARQREAEQRDAGQRADVEVAGLHPVTDQDAELAAHLRAEREAHEARARAAREALERAQREALEAEARERAEREERERLEAERLEAERLEAEAREQAEREERERLEAEAREQEAREQAAREQAAREERERLEAERLEAERLEAEAREQAEREERERLEAERLEAERLEQEAREQAAREQAEREERERLEAERLEAERLEQERLEAERLEQEAREQAAREQAEREERERLEAERLEAERLEAEAREQAEREERERLEAERLEAERLEQEAREQAAREAEEADARAAWEARLQTAREARERESHRSPATDVDEQGTVAVIRAHQPQVRRAELLLPDIDPETGTQPHVPAAETPNPVATAVSAPSPAVEVPVDAEEIDLDTWEPALDDTWEPDAVEEDGAAWQPARVVGHSRRTEHPVVAAPGVPLSETDRGPVGVAPFDALGEQQKPSARRTWARRLRRAGRSVDDGRPRAHGMPGRAIVHVALGALLIAGVIVGAPHAHGVMTWARHLVSKSPAPTVGTLVTVDGDASHPAVDVLAGAPVEAQATAGAGVPKGTHLVAVPLRLHNAGASAWQVPVAAKASVLDNLGVAHPVAKAVKAVKGYPLLPGRPTVAPGQETTGYAVFAVPDGRTVASVNLGLSRAGGDPVTWRVTP